MQGAGCGALGAMAAEHPANQAAVGEAGAAGLVATAMRGHPADERVQAAGCGALGSMSDKHPANTNAAREAGCVQLIATAMRTHPDEEAVQGWGREVLEVLEPGHALLA